MIPFPLQFFINLSPSSCSKDLGHDSLGEYVLIVPSPIGLEVTNHFYGNDGDGRTLCHINDPSKTSIMTLGGVTCHRFAHGEAQRTNSLMQVYFIIIIIIS